MLGHVLVHILGLDLEEQRLHLIVIKIIHQMIRELENAQAGVYWSVKNEATLVHLHSREVIIEDIGSGKGWAGYQAAQLVFLISMPDELHVDPLEKVPHSLPEYCVGQELLEVPLEVAGSLFPELCVHPDVGLHLGALTEAEGPVNVRERHAQQQVKLQVAGAFLVAEVMDQLLNFRRRHPNAKEVVLVL